jgi:hypothetical protein
MKKFINPSTGEIVTAKTKADIKMYTAFCWQKVKVVYQYDVKTGKKIQ